MKPNFAAISIINVFFSLISIAFSKLTHNVICFILFCIFMCLSIIYVILYIRQDTNISYEKGGDLSSWYQESVAQLGTLWCKELIEEIAEIVSMVSFSFLSSSANEGIYEKSMFWHISKKANVNFYVSDLALLPIHENDIKKN